MSFIDGVKDFIEKSRAGIVIALLVKEIRTRLDKDGDGKIEVAEILEALPTEILLKYGGELLRKLVPLLIPVVKAIQEHLEGKKV